MEKHSIGKTIAQLRRERGMTQAELAEKLFVTDKAVSKWEQDASYPSIEILPTLAQLFDVSIDYLMTGKGDVSEPSVNVEEPVVSPASAPSEPTPITVVVKTEGEDDDIKKEALLSDIERQSLNFAKMMHKSGELTTDQYEAQRRRILTGNNPNGYVRDGRGRDRKLIRVAPWHIIVYSMTIVFFVLAFVLLVKGAAFAPEVAMGKYMTAFGILFVIGLSHICFSAKLCDGPSFGWIVLSIISLGLFAVIRSTVAIINTATATGAGLRYIVS